MKAVREPHWLVKDFHVLYRVAAEAEVALLKVPHPRAVEVREALSAQVNRLRPAFEACEVERRGGNAERLTPAERKALNALHRWLHSPVGDDALIEDAADFHEQVEAECAEDCKRLEEEERMAWAQVQREFDGAGVCRVCGCTDDDCSQCVEKTGEPCHWVEPDLCSACVGEARP